jgi:DNA-binding MarR family transcriptional regulator
MDRATMMALVDRLEARGLVVRRRSRSDRRRQELYLTPRGQTVLKAAKAKIGEHERRIKRRFSDAELEALCAALRRLYE